MLIIGRSFVKKNESIYIQCRFNNEILTTDPVAQTTAPIWDTELAWDVDHKQLSYLRSARAPLKLLVYSLDISTGSREVLGWIVLDLRAAQGGQEPAPKWYPLQAYAKSSFRPEIKITFSVSPAKTKLDYLSPTTSPGKTTIALQTNQVKEVKDSAVNASMMLQSESVQTNESVLKSSAQVDVAIQQQQTSQSSIRNTGSVKQPAATPKIPVVKAPQFSLPIFLTPEGYYFVGQQQHQQQGDILDVTLWVTIAFAQDLNKVLTNTHQQATPLSPDTKYCFFYSFLGNEITTQSFVDQTNPNFAAERVSIRFQGLKKDLGSLFRDLDSISFFFCSAAGNGEKSVFGYTRVGFASLVQALEKEEFPFILEGVYSLFFGNGEEGNVKNDSGAQIGVSLAISLTKVKTETATVAIERGNVKTLAKSAQQIPSDDVVKESSLTTIKETKESTTIKTTVSTAEEKQHVGYEDVDVHNSPSWPAPPLRATSVSFQDLRPSAPPFDSHPSTEGIPSSQTWHQYRFSIELRSFRNFKLKSANIFLKYTYTPFGSASPYITHPVTQMTANEGESLLPHSFCSFEFVMAPKRLETYLESVPLLVEVFHKDTNRHNVLIGQCQVDLGQVLGTRKSGADLIQSSDFFSLITSLGPAAEKFSSIGEMRTLLALEDFGIVRDNVKVEEKVSSSLQEVDIHETQEYQAALELELWRQEQQEIFEERMKMKEKALEENFAIKLQQAQSECDRVLNLKLNEYKEMISKLQTVSDQLQERESAIERAERDLALEKGKLEREAGAALQSQRDAARRLEETFAHSNSLYRQRAEEAERKIELTAKERDTFRQKLLELQVKSQADRGGDWEKSAEITKLNGEILSLKSLNERLVNSRHDMKKKYKTLFRLYESFKSTAESQQKEIADLKNAQFENKMRQDQVQKELESLNKENIEIKELDRAVSALKQSVVPVKAPSPKPLEPSAKMNLDRLEKEKESLLETGVYSVHDQLIQEIDARIASISGR